MQTFSSITGSSLCHLQPPCFQPGRCHRTAGLCIPKRSICRMVGCASKRDAGGGRDSGGEIVDENMIVLRMRIHEMKMAERNYEPPSHWMEWEKRYYTSYDDHVCEVMALLQTFLMNTRPSLAIGMMVLLTLSVPTSVIMILLHLIEASRSVLAGLHFG